MQLSASAARLTALALAMTLVTSLEVASRPSAVAAQASGVLLSIPIGEDGVGMNAAAEEQPAWGPSAMAVDTEGTVWIADAVYDRIVGYSRTGNRTHLIDLRGRVVGIGDIDILGSQIAVLDYSAERVIVVGRDSGEVQAEHRLPGAFGLGAGLSGVAFGPNGDILLEFAGGTSTALLADALAGRLNIRAGRPIPDGLFAVSDRPDADRVRSSAHVQAGGLAIDIAVDHRLGGIYLAGERPGSLDLIVDEASQEVDGTVRVDRTVRRFDRNGRQVAIGRVPLSERAAYVPNGIAALPSGEVLALMPRPDRIDIISIPMLSSVAPVLPSGFRAPGLRAVDATRSQPRLQSCRDRRVMDNVTYGYLSLQTVLNNSNINGTCSGRMKPRSLALSPFPGVTYDWGGWRTSAQWASDMANNRIAGDINTTAEACDYGVDCSGFVQQIWGITDTKHNTNQLATTYSDPVAESDLIAYDAYVDPGSHIVIWHRWWNGGLDISESTTSSALDRTVHRWVDDSYINGYVPVRYVGVC